MSQQPWRSSAVSLVAPRAAGARKHRRPQRAAARDLHRQSGWATCAGDGGGPRCDVGAEPPPRWRQLGGVRRRVTDLRRDRPAMAVFVPLRCRRPGPSHADDSGKSSISRSGRTFTVQLQGTPGTGYTGSCQGRHEHREPHGGERRATQPGGRITGGPAMQTFAFVGKSAWQGPPGDRVPSPLGRGSKAREDVRGRCDREVGVQEAEEEKRMRGRVCLAAPCVWRPDCQVQVGAPSRAFDRRPGHRAPPLRRGIRAPRRPPPPSHGARASAAPPAPAAPPESLEHEATAVPTARSWV